MEKTLKGRIGCPMVRSPAVLRQLRFVCVFAVALCLFLFLVFQSFQAEVVVATSAPHVTTRREAFLKVKLPLQLPKNFTDFIDALQFPDRSCVYGLKVRAKR